MIAKSSHIIHALVVYTNYGSTQIISPVAIYFSVVIYEVITSENVGPRWSLSETWKSVNV
jgi:hypothetical protein